MEPILNTAGLSYGGSIGLGTVGEAQRAGDWHSVSVRDAHMCIEGITCLEGPEGVCSGSVASGHHSVQRDLQRVYWLCV